VFKLFKSFNHVIGDSIVLSKMTSSNESVFEKFGVALLTGGTASAIGKTAGKGSRALTRKIGELTPSCSLGSAWKPCRTATAIAALQSNTQAHCPPLFCPPRPSPHTVAPFERIRLILQTQSLVPGHRPYTGLRDALVRIPQEQGIESLWRGNTPNLLRIVPTYGLRFTFLDYFQALATVGTPPGQALTLLRQMASGALSGFATVLVTYPLDLARTRMSAAMHTSSGPAAAPGGRETVRGTLREVVAFEGLTGLYRGLLVAAFEITPYLAISLGGYEYLKGKLKEADRDSPLAKLAAAWGSGLCGSLFCFPIDTVRGHSAQAGQHRQGQRRREQRSRLIVTTYGPHVRRSNRHRRRRPRHYPVPPALTVASAPLSIGACRCCLRAAQVKRRLMLDGAPGFRASEATKLAAHTHASVHTTSASVAASVTASSSARAVGSARGAAAYARSLYATGGVRVFYRGCLVREQRVSTTSFPHCGRLQNSAVCFANTDLLAPLGCSLCSLYFFFLHLVCCLIIWITRCTPWIC